jgi:hypothetical protein
MRLLRYAVSTAAVILSATASLAADLPTKKPAPPSAPILQPSPWRFELTGYGWGSSLSGNTGIRNFPELPFLGGNPRPLQFYFPIYSIVCSSAAGVTLNRPV